MDSPYLTVDEVASLLRKSNKWVYSKKQLLPGYFKLEGAIFFDREILLSRLKELAFKPTEKVSRPASDTHGLL